MRYKIVVEYDTDPCTPENIKSYMHCAMCMAEWRQDSQGLSPREYARTQVGIMPDGNLQVFCTRHDCNVAVLKLSCIAQGGVHAAH